MRLLTQIEESRLEVLSKNSISLTLIEPTTTGLKKSIMDATGSVRNYLKSNGVHDYSTQAQGQNHKVIIDGIIYQDYKVYASKVSLYRPITKNGDPRIWFSGLTKHSDPNDIHAIIYFDAKLHIINITKLSIVDLVNSNIINPLQELVFSIRSVENNVSIELLTKLKNIAKRGPVPSMLDADTSVGRTLETALGIDINSSKKPDYKGIELKSFRANKGNRKNLFAQVPNWKLSKFSSSNEILNAFGYWHEDVFRLYCTVSAINVNSQGLSLKVDDNINQLIEFSNDNNIGDFVVWTLEKLHERLLEKHAETFWVSANTIIEGGKEFFQYTEVEHTKKPILSQFDLLIEQGAVTLDHLIKRTQTGSAREKGPIFKIKPNKLNLLFPPSEIHSLLS